MNRTYKLLALGLSLLTTGVVFTAPASAEEFSGNVAITTDYRFRGISQGDRSPAIQGGFDLELESGFYVGTWASNVTFSGAAMELDIYGGFGGEFAEGVGYDVGVAYYAYPEDDSTDFDFGDRDLDYLEIYGSISFGDATLGLQYSPDYFFETDTYFYLYGDYSFAMAENWSLDVHYGLNLFDSEEVGADFGIGSCLNTTSGGECISGGTEDTYSDWSIGVSTSAAGLDFTLQYIDTDLDKKDCFGGTQLCDSTAVFTVSKSL